MKVSQNLIMYKYEKKQEFKKKIIFSDRYMIDTCVKQKSGFFHKKNVKNLMH